MVVVALIGSRSCERNESRKRTLAQVVILTNHRCPLSKRLVYASILNVFYENTSGLGKVGFLSSFLYNFIPSSTANLIARDLCYAMTK